MFIETSTATERLNERSREFRTIFEESDAQACSGMEPQRCFVVARTVLLTLGVSTRRPGHPIDKPTEEKVRWAAYVVSENRTYLNMLFGTQKYPYLCQLCQVLESGGGPCDVVKVMA